MDKPYLIRSNWAIGCRILSVVALLLAPRATTLAQGSGQCVDPSSTFALDLRHQVGVLVSLSDTVAANQRARLGLPALAENQVTIVTDSAACGIASSAYDNAVSGVAIDKPVVILALGTQRLVIKDYRLGEWTLAILFDQTYTTMIKRFRL